MKAIPFTSRRPSCAFTLTELLVVIAIMTLIGAMGVASLTGTGGAGVINQAIGDLSATLDLAREYAMAHHTYSRVAIGEAVDGNHPRLVILNLYAADGTNTSDPTLPSNWPLVSKPLVLTGLTINDSLNSADPDTSQDYTPGQSTIGTLTRNILPIGAVSFTSFIEFNPIGEASVKSADPVRHIKIGIDQPAPQAGKNPFVIRLSGINGTINVLRKEQL